MRGEIKSQPEMLCLLSLEQRVPAEHPLRRIKKNADAVLKRLSGLFDLMYADGGRPSIPPERLLKAKILMALYSVRSDRLFCEMLKYNMLFLWFLDMDMMEDGWDHSTFSKYLALAVDHEVGKFFFEEVVLLAKREDLLSDEHFTVDGTLIESWASMKSFLRKGQVPKGSTNDSGNSSVDFHGEKRSNQTHESRTDPEARLMKKGRGKEAKLCFGAHALMENRHGLLMELKVTSATEVTEARASIAILKEKKEERLMEAKTLGADKGYHNQEFVGHLRDEGIRPHVAEIKDRRVAGLDKRTTCSYGYEVSQRIRKRVEEIFGWMKTVGGLRKSRYCGIAKTQTTAYWIAGAYNLLRISRLQVAPT